MSTRIGDIGERLVLQGLNALGLQATFGKRGKDADIVCSDIQIEVKTAHQGKDKKWRFTLWKKGSQNHRKAHYVLLCALLQTGAEVWFLIPVVDVFHKHHAVITSNPLTYQGKLAKYRLSDFSEIVTTLATGI